MWFYQLKSANEVVEELEDCFLRYGLPTTIEADNIKKFRNKTLVALCTLMSIQIIHCRPRNTKPRNGWPNIYMTTIVLMDYLS